MSIRVPAGYDVLCPKCGAVNRPNVTYVDHVCDERGDHKECRVCAYAWNERK